MEFPMTIEQKIAMRQALRRLDRQDLHKKREDQRRKAALARILRQHQ